MATIPVEAAGSAVAWAEQLRRSRVIEEFSLMPATLEDVCRLLSLSAEHAGIISRKLEELRAIEAVQGSFGTRLFVRDHLRLEELPRGEIGSKLEDEVKKFQDTQRSFTQKIESLRVEQAGKKKNLFAEMEKMLKEELDRKSRS